MIATHLPCLALAGLAPWFGGEASQTGNTQSPAKPVAQKSEAAKAEEPKTIWEYLSGRYDTNGDGKIAKDEYTRGETQFARLDKDKSGFIEEADTKQAKRRGGAGIGGGRGADARRGAGERTAAPTEGAVAPDFTLETLYPTKKEAAKKDAEKGAGKGAPVGEDEVRFESTKLSSLKGKKPVALIFGSYT